MRSIKLFSVIICITMLLTACSNSTTGTDSSTLQGVSSTPDVSDTATQNESKIEQPTLQKPVKAQIENFINTDKTVAVSGVLEDDKYAPYILQLKNILDAYSHNISLAVYSLDGTKGLAYNTNAQIFGACTVKAAYTLYACEQMENGNGSLDTQITYSQKHYEPGTGDMQYSPFGTVFTMETALYKSMSISDNVGYLMAVDYFGRDGYNTWVSTLGCDSLAIKPTVWSLRTKANDLVKIWCHIYNYFETDTEYARFLKSSCTNTAGNYATAALSDVEYSHKQGHNSTGDWLSLSDAGIVWKGDTPYIIAILTDAPGPSGYDANIFAQIIDIVHNELF